MADILKEKLEERRKKGKLLIPYLTFGYPDIPTFWIYTNLRRRRRMR